MLHDRAISLNPNLAIAWCFSGFALSYLGDQKTALERMGQAILLSPSDPHLFFFQAAVIMPHLLLGQYQDAANAGHKAIELNPWFSSSFKGHLAALEPFGVHRGSGERDGAFIEVGAEVHVCMGRHPPPLAHEFAGGCRAICRGIAAGWFARAVSGGHRLPTGIPKFGYRHPRA